MRMASGLRCDPKAIGSAAAPSRRNRARMPDSRGLTSDRGRTWITAGLATSILYQNLYRFWEWAASVRSTDEPYLTGHITPGKSWRSQGPHASCFEESSSTGLAELRTVQRPSASLLQIQTAPPCSAGIRTAPPAGRSEGISPMGDD